MASAPFPPSPMEGLGALKKRAVELEVTLGTAFTEYTKAASNPPVGRDETFMRALEAKIEGLVTDLDSTNGDIEAIAKDSSSRSARSRAMAVLGRFGELLRDYKRDFSAVRDRVAGERKRLQLMGARAAGGNAGDGKDMSGREVLLEEQDSVESSLRMTDLLIGQAVDTKAQLVGQRNVFGSMRGRLGDLSKRFPAVNLLMRKISSQQNRDNLILAAVIASCMLFTFFYVWSR